jgi:hypothetical protein
MQILPAAPSRTLAAVTTTLGAAALALTLFAGAATAKPKGDHDGDADRSVASHYTEDNDTNDGGTPNNVADDGDNRHPSGKDRSVEKGKGGNQGKAESDPDDDGRGPDRSNGGPDKPNGSGGVDQADQDGNNGCGNDDDFEDDNEGWCGRKPKKSTVPAAAPKHESSKGSKTEAKSDAKDETKGETKGAADVSTGATPATPGETSVVAPTGTNPCPWVDVLDDVDAKAVAKMTEGCATGEVLAASAVAGDTNGTAATADLASFNPLRTALAAATSPVGVESGGAAVGATNSTAGVLALTGMGLVRLLTIAGGALMVGWAALRAGRTRTA